MEEAVARAMEAALEQHGELKVVAVGITNQRARAVLRAAFL